jgi:DNA repair protein RadC
MPSGTLARERSLTPLQERFIRSGFDGFSDQETIELFLGLALSHRECHKLAKKCLERFKDFNGFLAASPQELERLGLTLRSIFSIKVLRELPAEVLKKKIIEQPFYKSSQEVFDYLYYSMRDLNKEVFKAIYLNSRNQIIDTVGLFEGTLESIPIRPREIVEGVIEHSAAAVVFVHNHPSGDPAPSKSDKRFTRDLVFMGGIIEVKVLDHIIIGGNKYFSFADEGLIKKYEYNFLNLKIRGVFDSGVGHRQYLHKASILHASP